MTYEQASKMINIRGLYYKVGLSTYKRKIVPHNEISFMKYQIDLLDNKKPLTNEDAKLYTQEDSFAIADYATNVLSEENFRI